MSVTYPIPDYYNRFDPAKKYEKHLARAGLGVQSAEFNEIQESGIYRLKGVADALFKDGDIVRDCQAIVNGDTGATSLEGGALYLQGAVRGVAPASFTIPVDRAVTIGIRLISTIVTELEDPELLDPAPGTRNYGEPGAGRLKVDAVWGWDGDGGVGEFFGVYTVDNGVLLSKEPPPQLDSVTNAIARYDRDSAGGNYIVEGLGASASYNRGTEKVVVLVGEGRARVNGYAVEIARSLRLIYDADPDMKAIVAEPHTFTPDGTGKMRVNLDATPLKSITQVRGTKQKVTTVTHGAFAGAKDPLPDNSVLSIVAVNQGGTWNAGTNSFTGGTTYVANTDYKLTSNQVDWSPAGSEVAPGSVYSVVYQYLTTDVTTSLQDDTGVTVEGLVSASLFTVDYTFALPRIDAIVLDSSGRTTRIKGVASQYAPAAPSVPDTQLRIASIQHNWSSDPAVISDAVTVLPMQDLQALRGMVFDLFDLVAQERLRTDIAITDQAAKRGVFVDPLTNDNLRDAGIAQNMAIIDGEMRLPIAADVHAMAASITTPQLLPYTLETLIEQPYRTTTMLVNPYQAFDPVPATIELSPGVDFWTTLNVTWLSEETRRFVTGSGNRSSETTTSSVQTVSVREEPEQLLRQISVGFKIAGFGPGEVLQTLTFDGLAVTPENP